VVWRASPRTAPAGDAIELSCERGRRGGVSRNAHKLGYLHPRPGQRPLDRVSRHNRQAHDCELEPAFLLQPMLK
jgi:hypothetical protein